MNVIKEQEILGKNFKMYGTVEEPLFLARDVAEWVEYSQNRNGTYNISQMLNSVDSYNKLVYTINIPGDLQARQHTFVNEFGLYECLMTRRTTLCKKFKREVCLILKQIRLDGYYLSEQMIQKLESENKQVLEQLQNLKLKSQDALTFVNTLAKCTDNITINEMARLLSQKHELIGRNRLFRMLKSNSILMQNNTPYQKYINQGYFEVTEVVKNGKIKLVTLITPKGQLFINKLYNNS